MAKLLGHGQPRRLVPGLVCDLASCARRSVASELLVTLAGVGRPQIVQAPSCVFLDELARVPQLPFAPGLPVLVGRDHGASIALRLGGAIQCLALPLVGDRNLTLAPALGAIADRQGAPLLRLGQRGARVQQAGLL